MDWFPGLVTGYSLLLVYRSGGSARTGLVPGGISTFRQNENWGRRMREREEENRRMQSWKDEERVELMGCIAYSGKHRNTIMSGV
ncbi:hypothetical protein NEUTE1DRAFT_116595 [Neurospora tetrasperma FGSC 2508]|uniref:Uncharacterized protein n=1 Tax=Neurospora tetrasperma (strain FGSC 2508 / ATCC MYA-4615 / P0657) TaxID=510951 RepID=F8MHN9_NEUT8|nr:uncharacterized protein NEUTE1DRAFT_116595 [Neurospora tetrasperma FGSC 2508]EGO59650.1 hypothetical protein NEUTE1DRAFT_116595 [Neurospora tetrasperma FGSC 2508]EGZ73785.1 hypothetical protein NEUTE2DRAFT_144287 [Neurospora tetrasperma FGSC 2509]